MQILVRVASEGLETRPRHQQIEIYEALAAVIPDPNQRRAAGKVAFALREAEKLQLEFARSLFTSKPS